MLYICIYILIYIYVFVHTHIYIYIFVCAHAVTCIYIHKVAEHLSAKYIIYVVNIYLLIALRCIHTVLRTYLPMAWAPGMASAMGMGTMNVVIVFILNVFTVCYFYFSDECIFTKTILIYYKPNSNQIIFIRLNHNYFLERFKES